MSLGSIRRSFTRYADLFGWLPLQLLLAAAAIVGFGALVRGLGDEHLRWLAELPITAAFALAATGISYLVWRRWRQQLTPEQREAFWDALMAGRPGAVIVFVVNAAFYAYVLSRLLDFFQPSR